MRLEEEAEKNRKITANYGTNKKAQHYLNYMGFDTGGVDGIIGVRSSVAIILFQYSQGLSVTGVVDDATLEKTVQCADSGLSYSDIMESDVIKNWVPGKPIIIEKNGELDETKLVRVAGGGKLNKEAAVSWAMMVNAAIEYNKTAVDKLNINEFALAGKKSGYRSYDQQVEMREHWINKITAAYNSNNYSKYKEDVQKFINSGLSEEQAIMKVVRQYSAEPGYSNHGLAIAGDFRFVEGSNSYNWMQNNASKYGFEPYAPEPWHWNYKP